MDGWMDGIVRLRVRVCEIAGVIIGAVGRQAGWKVTR